MRPRTFFTVEHAVAPHIAKARPYIRYEHDDWSEVLAADPRLRPEPSPL